MLELEYPSEVTKKGMMDKLIDTTADVAEKNPVQFFVIPIHYDYQPGSDKSLEVLNMLSE